MAANTDPQFTENGVVGSALSTAANTSSSGTGNIGTTIYRAFLAGASGAWIDFARFVAVATSPTNTTATVGRVYISSLSAGPTTSADTFLIAEVVLPITAADNATGALPGFTVPINLRLPAGWTILFSTHAAPAGNSNWRLDVIGGDYGVHVWSPYDLRPDLWLNPTNGVVGGATITAWHNSGFGNIQPFTASGTARPSTGTGINGATTINFDGTTDVLRSTTLGSVLVKNNLWSLAVVFRYTGTAVEDPVGDANAEIIGDTAASGGGYWGPSTSVTNFDNQIFTGGTKVQEQFTLVPSTNNYAVCLQNNGKLFTSYNGAALTSGTAVGTIDDLTNALAVGIASNQSVFFKGSIGDIIVSRRQWTTTEIANVNAWIQNRYSL